MFQKSKTYKSDRRVLIRKADKLWAKAILKRDGNVCQMCGKYGDNPHHIYSRRYIATRHLLINGIILCWECHICNAHKFPKRFMFWAKAWMGEAKLNELEKAMAIVKPDIAQRICDLEAFICHP